MDRPPPLSSARGRQASRWFYVAALLAFPLGCGLAALAIGQDISFDLFNYHYYNAWALLHGRYLTDVFPANTQTLIDPILDVPSYLLITFTPPRIAAFVLGFEQGLGPLLVVVIARRLTRSAPVALAAGVAAAVAGGFASELGGALGDAFVAPIYLLAVLLALEAIERGIRADRRGAITMWLLSGVCGGLAAGLKLAELPVAAGIAVAAAFATSGWRERLSALCASAAGTLAGAAVTAGYWTYFLWAHFGDPLAFTGGSVGFFHDAYAPPPPTAPNVAALRESAYLPIYAFFHPLATAEIPLREASVPIAYVLVAVVVVLGVVAGARRALSRGARPAPAVGFETHADRYVIAVFAVGIGLWIAEFAVYRYLIPLELLAPVVIVAALRRIAVAVAVGANRRPSDRTPRAVAAVFAALCAICVATAYPANYWERVPFGSTAWHVATPKMLQNGRLDAVVELGTNPEAFVFPLLRAHFVAIGQIQGGIGLSTRTPATLARATAAFAKVRRAGGDVVGMWANVAPAGSLTAAVAAAGDPGMRLAGCTQERLYIGAGYEPIGFCLFVPGTTGSS